MLNATTHQLTVLFLQGVFSPSTFGMLELPGNWYPALEWQYPPHQRQGSYEEEGRCVNTMKVGLGGQSSSPPGIPCQQAGRPSWWQLRCRACHSAGQATAAAA